MTEKPPPIPPNHPVWKLWKHQGLDTFGQIECAKSGCYECHNKILKLYKYRQGLFQERPYVTDIDERSIAVTKALEEYLIYTSLNPFKRSRGRARSDETIRREITICMQVSDVLKENPSISIEKACEMIADRHYSGSESVRTYFKKYVKRKK